VKFIDSTAYRVEICDKHLPLVETERSRPVSHEYPHTGTLHVESEEEILALQARQQAELDKITNTLGWRLLRHYGRFKYRFLLPAYRLFRFDAARKEMTGPKTES
jgi:hypothetical protein